MHEHVLQIISVTQVTQVTKVPVWVDLYYNGSHSIYDEKLTCPNHAVDDTEEVYISLEHIYCSNSLFPLHSQFPLCILSQKVYFFFAIFLNFGFYPYFLFILKYHFSKIYYLMYYLKNILVHIWMQRREIHITVSTGNKLICNSRHHCAKNCQACPTMWAAPQGP